MRTVNAGCLRTLAWAGRAIALWSSLVIPSLGLVQKYTGARGVLAYGFVVLLLCGVLGLRRTQTWLGRPRRVEATRVTTAFLVAALVAVFALGYPVAARLGTSDRDDALNLGVQALSQGRYPYEPVTPLGNAISVLPGSLLLAAPFVLAGNSAWQNLLWFPVWVLVLARFVGNPGSATAIAAVTLVASPAVLQDFVTGGDLATNAIIVFTAMALLVGAPDESEARRVRAALAVYAGVAFATRASFGVLVPVLGAILLRRAGVKRAVLTVGGVAAVAAVLILPVYAWQPDAFTPLLTQNKFRVIGDRTALVVPVAFLMLSMVAACVLVRWPGARWEVASALLLGLPPVVLTAMLLWSGARSLSPLGYAVPAVFFAVPGLWPMPRTGAATCSHAGGRRRSGFP